MKTATFGGGCFWCTEAIIKRLNGVQSVVSGYAGGSVEHPNYYRVCEGNTGHAEVVQVTFNPASISYKQLVEVFFLMHDPTMLNRQGNDAGTQYRSVIFYHTEEQKRIAESVKRQLTDEHAYDRPIVTEIVPYSKFYPAEEYHQQYYDRNEQEPYCRAVISPKLAKLRARFSALLKS